VERLIPLEGCSNFRDLGGYPTRDGRRLRWRVLFRSDALHALSAADVARLRGEIGLGDVIDLRSSGELRADGRGRLEGEALRFHHLPLFDGGFAGGAAAAPARGLADLYFQMVEFAKAPIARVIETLADAPGPAVYHCAAGKDRTGVVSAVLLGLFGVPEDFVVADYAATQENLDRIVERLMASRSYREVLSALPPETLHAAPDTMLGLLQRLTGRYGSVRGYVRSTGVSDACIARLESRLLEPGGGGP